MANTKVTARVIADDAITTAAIADDVALGGNPTTTTQSAGNDTTRIATTAFVSTAISNLVDSSPAALNTLNELAAALGDDAAFSTTVTNSIATKVALSGAGQTIADSGNFTVDAGGDIILDADGGDIRFRDGGTEVGTIVMDDGSNSYIFKAIQVDADIKFNGNDGGSGITALTLDMSVGGTANFAKHVSLGDSMQLQLGAADDFILYHDGTTNYIQSTKQDSDIIFRANDGGTNVNILTLDTSAAGNATFNGSVDIDGGTLTVGSGQEVEIVASGHSKFPSVRVNNNGYFGSLSTPTAMQVSTAGDVTFLANIITTDGSGTFTISGDSSDNTYFVSDGEIRIRPSGSSINKFVIGSNGAVSTGGSIIPQATATNDLGSTSLYWRDAYLQDVYTQDLHLSNEDREQGGNDIDGTRGDWTIQEGEENLYIINNKTGKKFKFSLEEVS